MTAPVLAASTPRFSWRGRARRAARNALATLLLGTTLGLGVTAIAASPTVTTIAPAVAPQTANGLCTTLASLTGVLVTNPGVSSTGITSTTTGLVGLYVQSTQVAYASCTSPAFKYTGIAWIDSVTLASVWTSWGLHNCWGTTASTGWARATPAGDCTTNTWLQAQLVTEGVYNYDVAMNSVGDITMSETNCSVNYGNGTTSGVNTRPAAITGGLQSNCSANILDNMGNSASIRYDKTAPVNTSFSINTATSASRTVNLTFAWTDTGGIGVASVRVYYSTDNASWVQCNTTASASGTLGCVVPSDGNFYYLSQSSDTYGNTRNSSSIGPYGVDTTPPGTPTVTSPTSTLYTTATSGTVTWGAVTDNFSGINRYQVNYHWATASNGACINQGGDSGWGDVGNVLSWGPGWGANTCFQYQVRAVDNYGWPSTASAFSAQIFSDQTNPVATTSLSIGAATFTNLTSITTTWTTSDAHSGTNGTATYVRSYPTNDGNGNCTGTLSGWTQIGSGSGSFVNSGLVNGACYQWATDVNDRAGNTYYQTAGAAGATAFVMVDTDAPTGGTLAINAGATYTSTSAATLTIGSAADNASGAYQMQVSTDGTLDSEPYETTAASKAVTLSAGDGTKTVLVRFKDRAGNVSATISDTIILDSSVPAAPVVATDVVAGSFRSGGTLFFNPAIAGTVNLTSTGTDAGSGITSSTFGALSASTGWTYAAGAVAGNPASNTLAWSGSAVASSLGVTTTNGAGLTSTATTLTLTPDITPPTVAISSPAAGLTIQSSTSVTFTWTEADTGGSGPASRLVTRQRVAVSGPGVCPATGWLDIGTSTTASPLTNSALSSGQCYQYVIALTDNVGNVSTTTSGVVLVDSSAPAAPTVVNDATGSSYASSTTATTIFFRPAGAGTITLTSTGADTESGIASSTFNALSAPTGWTYTSGTVAGNPAAKALTYSASAGSSTLVITTKNNANTSSANKTITLTADSLAPATTFTGTVAGNTLTSNLSATIAWTETESGAGLATRSTQRQIAAIPSAGTCTGAAWADDGAALTSTTGFASTLVSGNCYRFLTTLTDNVGNASTTTSGWILVGVNAPPAPVLTNDAPAGSFTAGSTIYFRPAAAGTIVVTSTGSDPEAGIASSTFGALSAPTGWTYTAGTVAGNPASKSLTWSVTAADTSLAVSTTNGTTPGLTSGSTPYNFVVDSLAPSVTTSVPFGDSFGSQPSYPLTFDFDETGAGLAGSWSVQRQVATPVANYCLPVTAAAAFRGSSAATQTTFTTSITVAAPAGIVDGDVMVAWITSATPTFVIDTVPAGWVRIDTATARGSAYYKVAGGEAPTYTWGFSSAVESTAIIGAWSGVNAADPILAFRRDVGTSALSHPIEPPPTTDVSAAQLAVFYSMGRGSITTSAPAGWTMPQTIDSGGTSSSAVNSAFAYNSHTGGALPTPAFTSSGSSSDDSMFVALRPAGVSPVLPNVRNSASTTSTVDATSLAAGVPYGTATGDVLVAFVSLENGGGNGIATASAPGWTVSGSYYMSASDATTTVLYHRVTAGDPATYTFSYGTTASTHVVLMTAVRGVRESGDPVGAIAGVVDNVTDVNWAVPGLTLSAQPTILLSSVLSTRGDQGISTLGAWPAPHIGLVMNNNVEGTNGFSTGIGGGNNSAADPAGFNVTAESSPTILGIQLALIAGNGPGWSAGTAYANDGSALTGASLAAQADTQTLANGSCYRWVLTATDKVGNVLTRTTSAILVDATSPVTTATPTGTAGTNGWYTSATVSVALAATDNTSGVTGTSYEIDGGSTVAYNGDFTVSGAGIHSVTYRSTDGAGNTESTKTLAVKIDTGAPSVSFSAPAVDATQGGTAYDVSWSASDPVSGIATQSLQRQITAPVASACPATGWVNDGAPDSTGSPVHVTGLLPASCYRWIQTVADNAGNSASATSATLLLNAAAPVVAFTAPTSDSAQATAGVTVTWTESTTITIAGRTLQRQVSPLAAPGSCAGTWTNDGAAVTAASPSSQTLPVSDRCYHWVLVVTDSLGQSSGATSAVITYDGTAPVTTATPTGTLGTNGWYTSSSVSVSLTATDASSNVTATTYRIDNGTLTTYAGSFVVSGEGDHTVTYSSTDALGNDEAIKTLNLQIDSVAPTTTATPTGTAGTNGWYTSATVSVALTSADTTSYEIDGGSTVTYAGAFAVSGEGIHTVTYRSTDVAGNVEAPQTLTIKIDSVAPSGSATYPAAGTAFTNSGSVSVTWTESDVTSGVAGRSNQRQFVSVSTPGVCGTPTDNGSPVTGASPRAYSLSTNGCYRWTTTITDNAGNSTTLTSGKLIFDNVAPVTVATPTGTAGTNGWYISSSVAVSLAASDAIAGVASTTYEIDGGSTQTYAGTFNMTSVGVHTITYRSTDAAGNVESNGSLTVKIDSTTPVTTASATGSAGSNGWYKTSVTVTLAAADATSGLASVKYTLNGGSLHTYTTPFAVATQGVTTVAFWSIDVAGNTETAGALTFQIDSVKPVTTATPTGTAGDNGWFTSTSVSVALAATDATAGVAATSYALDGGGNTAYTSAITITGAGTHSLTYFSTDGAGNVETTKTLTVKIDSTAPSTSATPSGTLGAGGWYTTAVTVPLSATDATSGVATTSYTLDGGASISYTGAITVGDGTHTLTYFSSDAAGNAESVHSFVLKVDTNAPTTSATKTGTAGDNGWFTSSSVSVALAATDADSGVAATSYTLDGGASVSYVSAFTVSGAGTHTVVFGSSDVAGNLETNQTVTVKIDTNAPATTATKSATIGKNSWYTTPVSVVLAATDATSGIAASTYSLDGGANTTYTGVITVATGGNHTVTFYSTDNAGNSNAPGSISFKIDAVAPATTFTNPAANLSQIGTAFAVAWTEADATSGLASHSIQRFRAELSPTDGITCGDFSPNGLATTTISPRNDTLAAGFCYRWTVTLTDFAGNTGSDTSPIVTIPYATNSFINPVDGVTMTINTPITVQWSTDTRPYTSRTLQRQRVAAVQGVCGTFANDGALVSNATSPLSATLTTGYCYRWVLSLSSATIPVITITSGTVLVDTAKPVTAATLSGITGTNAWKKGPLTSTLTATAKSGAVVSYTLDGGASQVYSAPFVVSTNGTHTVTYSAVSGAGLAAAAKTYTFKIDQDAPTGTLGAVPANSVNRKITIPATAADVGPSGIATKQLYYSTSATPTSGYTLFGSIGSTVAAFTFIAPSDETYYFYAGATDNAGNLSAPPAAAQGSTTFAGPAVILNSATATTTVVPATLKLRFDLASSVSGGTAPFAYKWLLTRPHLAADLTVTTVGSAIVELSCDAVPPTSTIRLLVTDAMSRSVTSPTIALSTFCSDAQATTPSAWFTTPLPATGTSGGTYSGNVSRFGGVGPFTYSIKRGTTVIGTTQTGTTIILPTVTVLTSYTYTIKITDANLKTFTFTTTVKVSP